MPFEFVAPYHQPPFTPIEVLVVFIGYASEKPSKMVDNSAGYSFNSWSINYEKL